MHASVFAESVKETKTLEDTRVSTIEIEDAVNKAVMYEDRGMTF